jgi:hypothetical protein
MIRLSTLFWLVTVALVGFSMFAVKYEVQSLADQLARTAKQADDAERDLHALAAEWAYLNRPDALAELNQRVLSLVPIATKQLRASLTDIPMRPAPLPAPPESVVAEAVGATMAALLDQATTAQPPLRLMTAAAEPATISPAAVPPGPTAAAAPPPPATQPAGAGSDQSDQIVVALDTVAAAQPATPATVKTVGRAARPHRAASLDELIAQISESR